MINLPDAGTAYELGQDFFQDYGINRLPIGATIGAIKLALTIRHSTASTLVGTGATVGIGVFDEEMEAEVPRPLGIGMHADWMYWSQFYVGLGAGTSTASHGVDTIQVKAMRKIEELGSRLWLVAMPNQPLDAGNSYTFSFASSTMVLLP